MSGEVGDMNRNILLKADELIHGERVQAYGNPLATFEEVADAASILLGKHISARDVCIIQVAMKLVRYRTTPENPDHLTDACGYLGILGDIEGYQEVIDERASKLQQMQTTPQPKKRR